MKVAIVGAGVAGLSCLHELERLGVYADVFEQLNVPGRIFPWMGANLNTFHRYKPYMARTLKKEYYLDFKPGGDITEIIVHGPTQKAKISGNLGFSLPRGQYPEAVIPQLHKQTKTPVQFNVKADYKKLKDDYDYVILATGNGNAAKEMGLWTSELKTRIRVAVVIGNFSANRVEMWLNTDYAKNGFTYLAPFDTRRATLAMVVPDVDFSELDQRWQYFLDHTRFPYDLVDRYDLDYETGSLSALTKGNLFFIGNAGGFVGSLIGMGAYASITSGVMCARAIAKGEDFYKNTADFRAEIQRLNRMRKVCNQYTNKSFDRIISMARKKPLQGLIYNTPLDVTLAGDLMSRIYLAVKPRLKKE